MHKRFVALAPSILLLLLLSFAVKKMISITMTNFLSFAVGVL